MGIDIHALRFLQYARTKQPLGSIATLGRQNLYLSQAALRARVALPAGHRYGPYAEELLIDGLGATGVVSFDASDFEGATVVHDFNTPLDHSATYDTVLDCGTLEHVFDLATAFRNTIKLCGAGGQILHVSPASNFNGHGFWQFSPELFFSLYSERNGFIGTEVFVAELSDDTHWWRADRPSNGARVEFTSVRRCYVLARTRRARVQAETTVQQSDYEADWRRYQPAGVKSVARPPMRAKAHQFLRKVPFFWRFRHRLFPLPDLHADARPHLLSGRNLHFRKVAIADVVPQPRLESALPDRREMSH